MDHAAFVGRFERVRGLPRDGHRVGGCHRPARDAHRQVLTFDQFHDQRTRRGLGPG